RIGRLLQHFQTKATRSEKAASESIQRSIEDVVKIVAAPGIKVRELLEKANIPELDFDGIRSDVQKLENGGVDNDDLVNFAAARILAATLIDDDVIEPLQQIRRIYSGEIAGRFFSIQLLLPSSAAADRNLLREEALKWQARIRAEEEEKEVDYARRRN